MSEAPAPALTAAEVAWLEAVAAGAAALEDVTARLQAWQESGQALYEERLNLYLLMRRLAVPNSTIAAHADATSEAVRVAIHKAMHPGKPSRPRKAT